MSAEIKNTENEREARLRGAVADLEQRVQEKTARLDDAVKELEAFSYSVSHDLRAPLRGITGFTRSLVEEHSAKLDDEGRRTLFLIRDEAQRMSELIEGLLDYSRVGRQRLEVSEIEMTALARCAFQNLAEAVTTRVPAFELKALPAASGDRATVRLVFANLLGNAIKFAGRQPAARIEVTGWIEGGWSTYCVADNGIGFDQRYAHKLFHVFQRLHGREEFPGSGVGLAVVQRIVQRHGGTTRAEGKAGGGARFYFTLPGEKETSA